jgi:hypothetical protein
MYIFMLLFQRKTENGRPCSFPNPLTACSLWNGKFVVSPFVYEETNGNYPLQTG